MAEGNQSRSPVSKIAVIGMIVAIVLFVSGMPWLWGCEGFPWPSAAGLILAFVIASTRNCRILSRPSLWETALGITFILTMVFMVRENFYAIRLLAAITIICLAPFSWHPGRRNRIAMAVLGFMFLVLIFAGAFDPVDIKDQHSIGSCQYANFNMTWIDDGKTPAWIENSSATSGTLVVNYADSQLRIPIGAGWHRIIPPRPGARLAMTISTADLNGTRTTICQLLPGDRITSMTLNFWYSPILNEMDSPWSPDGRYFYFSAAAEAKKRRSHLLDADSGEIQDLGERDMGDFVRWLDHDRFVTCRAEFQSDPEPDEPTTRTIQMFETDTLTRNPILAREFSVFNKTGALVLKGLEYALADDQLIDLKNGMRIPLPRASRKVARLFDWNARKGCIAYPAEYISPDDDRPAQSVIVFNPKLGICSEIRFEPQMFSQLKLSPECDKLFLRRSSRSGMMIPGTATSQAEIWDLKSKTCRRLHVNGVISSIPFAYLPSYVLGEIPHWTPDGKYLAYTSMDAAKIAKRVFQYNLILARVRD